MTTPYMNMTTPLSTNKTMREGALFTWHGTELLVLPLIMLLGTLGNLLVFYIYHFRWHSNTVTLFKRMLAVLDLSNLLLALPSLMAITVDAKNSSFMVHCIFTSFVALSSAIASASVLVIIAADRFMKLCLLRKKGIGVLLAKKLFAASVIAACIINIPTGWIFGRDIVEFYNYNIRVTYCFIRTEIKQGALFIAYFTLLGIVFLAVSTALVVLYYRIIKTLINLSNKHEELKRRPSLAGGLEAIKKQKQSEVMRKSAVVFIVITVVFFASYAPYFVTMIISMTDHTVEGSMGPGLKALFDLAKLCPLVNNVANPFIYSFTSGHFRKEVRNIFTFKTCKKDFFRRRAFSLSRSDRSRELSTVSDSREES